MNVFEVRALSNEPSNHNGLPKNWAAILGIALVAIASYATGVIGS